MIHFGASQHPTVFYCFHTVLMLLEHLYHRTIILFCELKKKMAHIHKTDKYEHDLTWELMMRMVVLLPTSLSYPLVGAELNLRTASWESRRDPISIP